MDCPRCGAPLRERSASARWSSFFECSECWATFEKIVERHYEPTCAKSVSVKFLRQRVTLQSGRTPSRRKLYTLHDT